MHTQRECYIRNLQKKKKKRKKEKFKILKVKIKANVYDRVIWNIYE